MGRIVFILLAAVTMVTAQNEVPGVDNYRNVLGVGRFRLHVEQKSYTWAANTCGAEDARLAAPTSKEVHDVLVEILRKGEVERAFVGIDDRNEESKMVTSKGELYSEVGYTPWMFGEPNDAKGEDCAVMTWDGLLNDVNCNTPEQPFICEKVRLFPHNPF